VAAADARLPSCQHRIAKQREVVGFGDADVEDPAGMAITVAFKDHDAVRSRAASNRALFVLRGPSQRIFTSWPTSASSIGSTLNIAAEGFPLDLASFAKVGKGWGSLIDVKTPKWVFLR
jgi:hypothetical protein